MSNIKVGDRVKVIGKTGFHYADIGMVGTVMGVGEATSHYAVEFDTFNRGHNCGGRTYPTRGQWMVEDDLEVLNSEKEEKTVSKFHVGDTVVLKANSGYISFTAGEEGQVVNIDPEGDKLLVALSGRTNRYWLRASALDLKEQLKPDWKIVIIPDGDKTTAKLYRNGKVEKGATVQRYHKDEYDVFTAADEAVKKLFGKQEKPEPEKPKGYTGTAVSKAVSGGFTYGKVYSFEDGYTTDDYGAKRPCMINVYSTDEWIDKYFIKIKE